MGPGWDHKALGPLSSNLINDESIGLSRLVSINNICRIQVMRKKKTKLSRVGAKKRLQGYNNL